MSGRSAYVRKQKENTRRTVAIQGGLEHSSTIFDEFPIPNSRSVFDHVMPVRQRTDLATIKSASSESEDLQSHGAYQRVRKPHVPLIIDTGIEKSSFRSMMDKKSEGARKALSKTFGKKKKYDDDERPPTSATVRPDAHEIEGDDYYMPPPPPVMNLKTYQPPEYIRPGPPSTKLPPIPQGPQLKRWVGGGRAPQPWNKLRKDPELWDPNGDTLIYLGHENQQGMRPAASFRVNSHVIENTESHYLLSLLRNSSIDQNLSVPPSPMSALGMQPAYPSKSDYHQPTPPMSESDAGAYDGQISYEITFPVPLNQSKADTIRHQVTTRNVFALLHNVSLVGSNLFQTLTDLQERLETYMPADTDAAGMIIDWLMHKDMDDVRDNPSLAAALLAWSESQAVRWEEGWKESYVHSAGMYHRMESTADFRYVSPISRALLERANLEIQVKVQNCEYRLVDFDFGDMWPMMNSQPPPARLAFERLRKFFTLFFVDAFGVWPPTPPMGEEQWLTRSLVQKLQKDFGALYDYLVNREVSWDCSEERSGRKWNIIHAGTRSFEVDTFDLPFTDLLVAFDNRHRYPHIPHPYPLVPESIPVKSPKENLFKTPKKTPKADDKMAERRAALAYTESTNIYLLGSDFVNNDMVDAFMRFEKVDRAAEVDPYDARRGRWILIYGMLQTLASLSVDTPNLRYTDNVSYHLSPTLRGLPPWKGATQNMEQAQHTSSYCWIVRDTWHSESPVKIGRPRNGMASAFSQAAMSSQSESSALSYEDETINGSDTGSFIKPPFSPASSKPRSSRTGRRLTDNSGISTTTSSGYGPGIEKVGEWPIRDENRAKTEKDLTKKSLSMNDLAVRNFDNFK